MTAISISRAAPAGSTGTAISFSRTTAAWAAIRAERNSLIAATDWTRLDDAPLTVEQRQAWQIYRQGLRDVTKAARPQDVIWPTAPGATDA